MPGGIVEIICEKVDSFATASSCFPERPSDEGGSHTTVSDFGMYMELEDLAKARYRPVIVGRLLEPLDEKEPNDVAPAPSNEKSPQPKVSTELFENFRIDFLDT